MTAPTKECAHCGKTFPKRYSTSLRNWENRTKYCSNPCRWAARRRPLPQCARCGKKPVANWNSRYCSRECSGRPLRVRHTKQCEHCGGDFTTHPPLWDKQRFCSRACVSRHRWNGHVSTTIGTARKHARKLLKAACEHCGTTDRLHAHHEDRNPFNNDPANVTTLCVACHTAEHHRRGDL